MPINPQEGLYEYAKFDGMRNTVPLEQFGLEDLEAGTNVDIDDAKRATRRKGCAAALMGGNFTSLWNDPNQMLAISGGSTLVRVLPDYAVLRAGLTPGLDMAFTYVADRVFYSNRIETGIIRAGRSRTWGLEVPPEQPIASAIGGVLPAGRYQFAVTYLRSDSQESGTLAAGSIDLLSDGGVRLDSIASSSDPDVAAKVVYCSKWNDDTLFRAGIIPPSATRFNYQLQGTGTVQLITQHLRPAPAGQIVDNFNGGRTLVAVGNVLYYSEPYSLELFDLRKNYTFESEITLLVGLDNGAYLGTDDQVIWMAGKVPETWDHDQRLAYGAILGASTRCSRDMILEGGGNKPCAVFMTTRGLCVGDEGGNVTNLTQDRFLPPIQPRGSIVVRQHRGMIQALAAMRGGETAPKVSS